MFVDVPNQVSQRNILSVVFYLAFCESEREEMEKGAGCSLFARFSISTVGLEPSKKTTSTPFPFPVPVRFPLRLQNADLQNAK